MEKLNEGNQKNALELKTVVQEKAPLGYEKFSVTLKRGRMTKETLHVLVEFHLMSRPHHMLRFFTDMLMTYLEEAQDKVETMGREDYTGMEDFLRLMYSLWEAEHKEHNEYELDFF